MPVLSRLPRLGSSREKTARRTRHAERPPPYAQKIQKQKHEKQVEPATPDNARGRHPRFGKSTSAARSSRACLSAVVSQII